MNNKFVDLVYPHKIRHELEKRLDIYAPPLTQEDIKANPSILQKADVIFSGWDGPILDRDFLDAAPNLDAFFYGAGTVKPLITEDVWDRNLTITTAVKANAIPVAEYTLSQILFSLKNGWQFVRNIEEDRSYSKKPYEYLPGGFDSTVGIISLSTIGTEVVERLKHFDVQVLAYDPLIHPDDAKKLNVTLCSVEEIFEKSDVISLHAPLLQETRGMINKAHFLSMKKNASFINTARRSIVNEEEMIKVLEKRSDITAIIDVIFPEPTNKESLLYTLPNIILTPHIAGSEGKECARLGHYMLEEFKRYIEGDDLKWKITREQFSTMPES